MNKLWCKDHSSLGWTDEQCKYARLWNEFNSPILPSPCTFVPHEMYVVIWSGWGGVPLHFTSNDRSQAEHKYKVWAASSTVDDTVQFLVIDATTGTTTESKQW